MTSNQCQLQLKIHKLISQNGPTKPQEMRCDAKIWNIVISTRQIPGQMSQHIVLGQFVLLFIWQWKPHQHKLFLVKTCCLTLLFKSIGTRSCDEDLKLSLLRMDAKMLNAFSINVALAIRSLFRVMLCNANCCLSGMDLSAF